MRKDGILEALKSSRLRVRDDNSTPPGSSSHVISSSKTDTVSNSTSVDTKTSTRSQTQQTARTVAEARVGKASNESHTATLNKSTTAIQSSRGMPKSGRVWKPLKSARYVNHIMFLTWRLQFR